MLIVVALAHAAGPLTAVTVPLVQAAPDGSTTGSVVFRNDGASSARSRTRTSSRA